MKIGVLSDTHNQADATRRALDILREQGAMRLIHCGDITTPAIVELFAGWEVAFVYGNMDANRLALESAVAQLGQASIGHVLNVTLGGARIVACHGDDAPQLKELVRSGLYDYVLHGHTHTRRDELAGSTRVINPGALGGTRRQSRSVCLLDSAAGAVSFVELDGF